MPIGLITGSGTYSLAGLEDVAMEKVETRWGEVALSRGRLKGREVIHVSRHGEGHARLSNHVSHRANIAALAKAGAIGAIGLTVCGAVDPALELGSLVCFDDLHFPSNRLPSGELCTFHSEPGGRERGHWIFEDPFSPALRDALLAGAVAAGLTIARSGCYGHVDGPRFNTRAEIRGLSAIGVTAVSQTAGPETVLAGEADLPFALVGYATDYANGVQPEPTPVSRLLELIQASTGSFARLLEQTIPLIDETQLRPAGVNYRFEDSP